MGGDGLASATRFLVLGLSVLYLTGAAAGPLLIDFDSTRDVVVWVALLVVGAALMLVGQLVLPPEARSALLVSLGVAIGGLLRAAPA